MSSIHNRAMVLAAGLGLRMRPLTDNLPKPLLPVAGKTMLDRALDWLAHAGVHEAVVNSHYKADMIESHLVGRKTPHVRISYEKDVLETGGGIRQALPLLGPDPFFSVNGDVITLDGKTPTLQRLLSVWDDKKMDALLLLHPVEKAVGYNEAGDFFLDDSGVITRRLQRAKAPYVFTGVQLIHPRLFKDAPEGKFSTNVLYNRGMSEEGKLNRIYGLAHDGDWLHVGDPEGLKQAERWLLSR